MTSAAFWDIASRVCTERELAALRCRAAGHSLRSAARELDISITTLKDRLDRAERKIEKHLDLEEAS